MNDLIDFAQNLYDSYPEFEELDSAEVYDLVADIISTDDYYAEKLEAADESSDAERDIEYNRSLDDIDIDIEKTAKKLTKIILKLRREKAEDL